MPSSRRRTGFTLVELLVVLGIIVVLVSILLPVLKNIREQSKSVTCSSNMHEILVAMNAYVSASDGAFPVVPRGKDTYPPAANDPVAQSLAYYTLSPGSVLDFRDGKLWRYLGGSDSQATASPSSTDRNAGVPEFRQRIFNCPTDTDGRADGRNFSYTWNFNTRFAWADAKAPPGVDHLMSVVEPVHKAILIEEQAFGNSTLEPISHVGGTDKDYAPAVRHLKRANCAFADGHVDAFAMGDLGYALDQTGKQVASPTPSQQTMRAYYFRLNSNATN